MMEAGAGLVVTTPERVAFEYPLAGIGSRFLAQCVDFPIQIALMLGLGLGALAFTSVTHLAVLALLAFLVMVFVVIFGYFWVLEAAWSGQTVGKYAFGLRVVDDQGGPLSFSQAAIRNLVRIADFLPLGYGIGLAILFAAGSGKRLGDYAAGTLVVRERGGGVRLSQLAGSTAPVPAPSWLSPADASALRLLDPDLRRFVVAYGERAAWLDPWRRYHLAQPLAERLSRVLPEVVAEYGPLVALDRLAWLTMNAGGQL